MRAAGLAGLAVVLSACSQFVRYTDEIVDRRTGRSWLVRAPATAGGFCGFVAGIPVDVIALPATFTLYQLQRRRDKVSADAVSTLLFPSFVLWRAGTLIAIPFDMIEYAVVRGWQRPDTLTEEERRALEYDLDEDTLPEYRVEPVYPPAARLPGSS